MVCLTSVYFNMCQLNFKIVRIISEFYMANFFFYLWENFKRVSIKLFKEIKFE